MLITLYVALFVLSLVGLVGIVPAMRVAWAASSTAGDRFRAVGKVAFDKLSLPATWGTLALWVPGRSAPYVVFVLAFVVLALFVIVALAWALAYVVPWLWRLPQSLRATYTRTPPRTS
jgi:hypothetical protein